MANPLKYMEGTLKYLDRRTGDVVGTASSMMDELNLISEVI